MRASLFAGVKNKKISQLSALIRVNLRLSFYSPNLAPSACPEALEGREISFLSNRKIGFALIEVIRSILIAKEPRADSTPYLDVVLTVIDHCKSKTPDPFSELREIRVGST